MNLDYIQKIVFLGSCCIILLGLAAFADNARADDSGTIVTSTNQMTTDQNGTPIINPSQTQDGRSVDTTTPNMTDNTNN